MKKHRKICCALVVTIFSMLFIVAGLPEEEQYRVVHAQAGLHKYIENGDYMIQEFITQDGNKWEIDDCVCPIGAECKITFDTKGTEEIEDDEIVKVESVIFEK